jgi:hypothetical protein
MDLKKMTEHAAKGRMNRREFIQFGVALGLTTAAASTLFSKAVRAEPKKGGTFRIALGSGATTDTLDPATYPDTFNGVFGWGSIRSSLTEVAADGTVVPDAAESFEAADDPRPGSSSSARASNSTTASRSMPTTSSPRSIITARMSRSRRPSRCSRRSRTSRPTARRP